MKHIKSYESKQNYKYNIGDFVILDINKVKINNRKFGWSSLPNDTTALINERFIDDGPGPHEKYYNYNIEFYYGIDNMFQVISDDDIDRIATQEEINIFNAKKYAKKYNL